MATVDLGHLPEGVVILPELSVDDRRLTPRAWVEAVRRPSTRRLALSVADHLARARELGEV